MSAWSPKNKLSLLIYFNLSLWVAYFYTYWANAYVYRDGYIVAKSLGVWADGAAHLTYVSSLAYQQGFPQHLPVYFGKPFIYPFLSDGLAALFVRLGTNLFTAYSLVGLILSLVTIFTLYRTYRFIFKSEAVATLAINLFFLSGGFGFIYFFIDLYHQGWDLLSNMPKEYTLLHDQGIYWLNIITGELIPQRAMLLGIPIGLLTLTTAHRLLTQPKSVSKLGLLSSGILLGLMPIIHPHSLIALTPALIWLGLISLYRHRQLTPWLFFTLPALILGLPLIFGHILPESTNSITWHPGWLAKSNQLNFFGFWFKNWGVFPLLAVFGLPHLTRDQKHLVSPFIFLFILANLFLFQAYDWDNSKLFTWVYLILSPVVATFLVNSWGRSYFKNIVLTTLVFTMTFSGVIDITRQLRPHTDINMYSQEELDLVHTVRTHTPADSIFLTSDLHTHPIPTLTGRQIIMGYRGWLWSYGIDYSQREQDVAVIYQGGDQALNLINQYGIDYVVISTTERERFSANSDFFNTNFDIFLKTPTYTIYQTS